MHHEEFEDSHTEVTGQSWFSRIRSAASGIGVGLILFLTVCMGLVFKPLPVAAEVIPVAGSLVAASTGMVAFLLGGNHDFAKGESEGTWTIKTGGNWRLFPGTGGTKGIGQ